MYALRTYFFLLTSFLSFSSKQNVNGRRKYNYMFEFGNRSLVRKCFEKNDQ